jgi:hypothetical protein
LTRFCPGHSLLAVMLAESAAWDSEVGGEELPKETTGVLAIMLAC